MSETTESGYSVIGNDSISLSTALCCRTNSGFPAELRPTRIAMPLSPAASYRLSNAMQHHLIVDQPLLEELHDELGGFCIKPIFSRCSSTHSCNSLMYKSGCPQCLDESFEVG